jgi:iron complex outermembrane recepter protein
VILTDVCASAEAVAPVTLGADIPAQPLARALAAFANRTGLQLVYVSGVVANQRSHAVSAGLRIDLALARMLRGTGLRFEYLTPKTIRILAAIPSPTTDAAALAGAAPSEVIVTANRREEKLEDVPMTIQTLGGEQLHLLSVTTFDSSLQHTANVTYNGNGPATGNIFIRGLGSVAAGNQEEATTAPFPNVALYLDDQSMQFPARNNDVYMVDLERVEILEGPQGTLFGGGAQAGAIRYITHQPKLDITGAEANAGYGITAGGAANTVLSAVLNVPLVEHTLAARAVLFSERQGGYIDNVASTIGFQPGTPQASTRISANNASLVGTNINPIDYQGVRLSVLWKYNEDWSLLLQQNYQDVEADGSFFAYPSDSNGKALQPYQVTAFTSPYTKDRYESTSWRLNGEHGPLSAVYAGSFMVRNIDARQDYSNYLRSETGSTYACIGSGAGYFNSANFPNPPSAGLQGTKLTCYPPVGDWHDTIENQHQSHELRLSTDARYRLRGIAGAYWEKFVIFDQMDFNYLAIPQCDPANLAAAEAGGGACLSAVGPIPGTFANDPGLRTDTDTAFGNDDQRGYKQLAFFGSLDLDVIPKILTLSAGTRHYRYDEFESGSLFDSATVNPLILNHPNGACTQAGAALLEVLAGLSCGIPIDLSQHEGGFVSRANLSWHASPHVMAYFTFSQGFRPASFNRTFSVPGQAPLLYGRAQYCGAASSDPRCQPGGSLYDQYTVQYVTPLSYKSDRLINNEIGVKSELLDHRVVLNVSAYRMNWNDVQWPLADFVNLGTIGFVANGPSYTIQGIELQLSARIIEGLTLQAAGSWNHSAQTNAPCLLSAGVTLVTPYNPTPAGQCITVINGQPYTNPWGPLGSALPFSPQLQFNVRAQYGWNVGVFRPFVTIGASHTGSMSNAPENYPDGDVPAQSPPTTALLKYSIPGYTTYEGSLGVVKDNWTAQVSGTNLTNAYGPANVTAAPFIKADIPLRPRVLMFTVRYAF